MKKKVLILGGTSKYGESLTRCLDMAGYDVLALGREHVDFANGWMHDAYPHVVNYFEDPQSVDAVIINVYDNRIGHEDVQQRVFDAMYDAYSKKQTKIVLIGCMTYRFMRTAFSMSKSRLAERALERVAKNPEGPRIVLIEPMALETSKEKNKSSYATVNRFVKDNLGHSIPYVQIQVIGNDD